MKKALKIAAVSAGVIGMVSVIFLSCIYLRDIAGYLKNAGTRVKSRVRYNDDLS